MKIAFIHYHLKPGGVTTVIRQQIAAIKNDCEVLAIAGETPPDFPAAVIPIPGIAYDHENSVLFPPEETASQIIDSIKKIWPNGCDILHVHNPTLAKNKNFLKIIKILQRRGMNLLLQVHDFAEDGRPLSYFPEEYPTNCHYSVINSRDFRILLETGIEPQGLHLLPNMVNSLESEYKECNLNNFVLYPVRAIRRKNIGEAILLSLFFQHGEILAITLPPNSPVDIASYIDWKGYVALNKLRVEFEASSKHSFFDLVCNSKFLITTSITEGFGFSFLEPWTAGKVLWGRKIPDICIDFQKKGIYLENLYTEIKIPIEWIGREQLFDKLESTITKNFKLYHYALDHFDIEDCFLKFIEDDWVDFGLLEENFQKQIISMVISSSKNKNHLIAMNPFLNKINVSDQEDIVVQNKKRILAQYDESTYRKNLLQIYTKMNNRKIIQSIDKRKLFFQFLKPERLNLLKWSEYAAK